MLRLAALALIAVPFGGALTAEAAGPDWNATGNYVITMNYLGSDYQHDLSLAQDSGGNLTGSGGSPSGAQVYTWVLTSGSVSSSTIDFYANYTATADAVTPQTTMHVVGTIAANGTMSGTWSDNYQGGARSGTWTSTSGAATAITPVSPVATTTPALHAEDFGVVNYDTGLGFLKGYSAGFGLTDATFAGAQSAVVKLYAASTLLQTNTAILPKFNADITGTQVSSPFDVSGSFNYPSDGYWTNVRETQFGQSVAATRVVATVTLSDGTVVTAENTSLTGNPSTIFATSTATTTPPVATTTTGVISGTFFNDLNHNGKKNANEPGIAGFKVNLYANGNWYGKKSTGPVMSATTDANGFYSFTNLPAGKYGVEEITRAEWHQDTSDYRNLKLTASSTLANINFANTANKHQRDRWGNWSWIWVGSR